MSEICTIIDCRRTQCALCHCCKQNICRPHLNEHQDSLNAELHSLGDRFNSIKDRINAATVDRMTAGSRQKLEQWRDECRKKIGDIFERKCDELQRLTSQKIDEQKEESIQIRSTLSRHIQDQDATRQTIDSMMSTVRNLEQEMDKIENLSFNIKIQPLVLDNSLIEIEELDKYPINISTLAPAFGKINHSEKSYLPLASNDHVLLVHQLPNLCLINKDLNIIERRVWGNGKIQSMCWSATLDQFIVINENSVFLVDEKINAIQNVQTIRNVVLYSCTCSDTSLFLSTYEMASPIREYNLLPTIQFFKEWRSSDICKEEEWINDMSYNHGTIALVIKNPSNKTYRIELKNSKTFVRLWLLQLNIENVGKNAFACCSLVGDGWLVIDPDNRQLLYITKNGGMGAKHPYQEPLWFAKMFGSKVLAITTTNCINFHKL